MRGTEKAVFRQLAVPVSAFDHIKATRKVERRIQPNRSVQQALS